MKNLFVAAAILLICQGAAACQPDAGLPESDINLDQLDALVDCLTRLDPQLRDQYAYTRLTELLRSGDTSPEELIYLWRSLDEILAQPDLEGVAHPFAILVLAEVARTDRIAPWMGAIQRQTLVNTASSFLINTRDYRGFDEVEGWRHAVAHGADLIMQLALNPEIDLQQQRQLLDALASQIAPPHAYQFGEPERLARPILFLALRQELSEGEWQNWFEQLADPAPLASWEEVWTDRAGLARRHNLRAFALEIYLNATLSTQPGIQALKDPAIQLLEQLP